MATANELLTGVLTVDKTLVIDNDFRTIHIPSSVPNLGVEYDDDVLKLDFKMPRYVGNTDLSAFSIRINYLNSQGESDVYTVSNPVIYDQYITFSWTVGPTATRYKGNTKFIVCAKTLTSDGYVDREFNTTIATLPVLEGLEVDESVVTAYSDIIEQWRQELFGIGDTEESFIKAVSEAEQKAIANKGAEVLATIPADYATAVSMTDNADRTKADAIICSTQGEVIRVEDSSDDYLRGLRVFGKTTQVTTTGKNLLNVPDTIDTTKGVSFVVKPDRTVVATGTPTEVFAVSLYGSYSEPLAFPAGDYVVSGGVDENHYIRIRIHSSDGTLKTMRYSNGVDKEFTIEDGDLISISIYFASLNGVNNMTFYPMVRYASITDNTYEPYSGGVASPNPYWPQNLISIENPTIDIYGKNLAVQKFAIDTTVKGIRMATSDNASEVSLNGTAEQLFSHTVLRTGTIPPGIYTVSTYGINLHDDGHDRLYVADYYTGKIYTNYIRDGSPKTIILPEATRLRIDMVFKEGTSYENCTLKIQVEAGSVATDYEACKITQSTTLDYTLHGIPVAENGNCIDSNGRQWLCDEVDFERGIYIKRVEATTFNGTERWQLAERIEGRDGVLFVNNSLPSPTNAYCTHYSFVEGAVSAHTERRGYFDMHYGQFRCNAYGFDTAEDFVSWLTNNPIVVIYPLDEPIEIPLTEDKIAAFRFAHTNFSNTTLVNDYSTMMYLRYNADTKIWLENLPKATDEQVRSSINAWLEAHYTNAEGVRF